ncbi:hypothetical protein ACLB2K_023886 [Fragaria x ananassa]
MNHSDHVHFAYYFAISLLTTFLIVLGLVLLLILLCKKKHTTDDQSEEAVIPARICPRVYPLTDIDVATDGFNRRRIVGEGRLGTVYAAIFEKGEIAAVKRIHPRLVLGNIGFGFSRTLSYLSLAQHPNIVPIVGYSEAPGAATGLQYLHEGVAPNIVHGCVKASNILIDVNFYARVCDYGLSFLAPKEKRGLVGYVDDEYWRGGGVCKESDMYGFGVVLLELLSGRRCEEGFLVKWALPLIKEMRFNEFLDPRLVFPRDIMPLVRMAKVASTCVSNSRKSRPSISQVATILNNLEIDST